MRGFLSIAALIAFQLALYHLFTSEVRDANRELIVFMLGQLSGITYIGYNFYFATSKSSEDKSKIINDMQERATASDTQPPYDPKPYQPPEYKEL